MPEKLAYQLYRSIWSGLDLLYPPRCGGCEVQGTRWCVKCADSLQTIRSPICPVCGWSLANGDVCTYCAIHSPGWDHLRSVAVYGGRLRHAIHRLKYERDLGLGEELSKQLIKLYGSLDWEVELVIPIPLDLARMKERGYNQASLLALPLALYFGLPYNSKALRKVRETPRQVTLDRERRRTNLRGAFRAEPGLVAKKKVLLIDDVTTTGATLDACSEALREANVDEICILTLARAGVQRADEDSWEIQ